MESNNNNTGSSSSSNKAPKAGGRYSNNDDRVRCKSVAASKPACDKLDAFVRSLSPDTALDVVKRCLECTVIQPNSTWLLRDLLSRTVWDNLFEVVLSVRTRDACLEALHVPSTECVAFDTLRADGVLDTFLCRSAPQLRMEVAAQVAQSGAPCSVWHTRGNFYSDPSVLYDMVYESGLRRFCQRLSNDLLRRVCVDLAGRERSSFSHQLERERAVDVVVKSIFGEYEIADRQAHDAMRHTPPRQQQQQQQQQNGASMIDFYSPPPIGHGQHRTCLRAAMDIAVQPIPLEL
jgi:hypothetical protein